MDAQINGRDRVFGALHRAHLTVVAEGALALAGGCCASCGLRMFPRGPLCPECWSEDIGTVALSERGVLYTYTVVHVGGAAKHTPFGLGYVDLPEGVRILAHLTTTSGLQPGIPVRLVTAAMNDPDQVAFGFSPETQVP